LQSTQNIFFLIILIFIELIKTMSQLKEGRFYSFLVKNIIELGADTYFIMQDPFGDKQLMPIKFYQDYNIKVGETITCKVDKINCSGKIFLEPEHPYYKKGEVYTFKYINRTEIINSINKVDISVIVEDVNNNKIQITGFDFEPDNQGNINARIDLIKKGRLYLSFPDAKKTIDYLVSENFYEFTIIDLKTFYGDQEHWVLQDDFKNQFYLRVKYYDKFCLSIGKVIKCEVVKIDSNNKIILEPEHPFYKKGEMHEFKLAVNRKEPNTFEYLDMYDNKCYLYENKIPKKMGINNTVTALIIKLKKGRPVIKIEE